MNVDFSRIDFTAGTKRQLALDQKLLKLCQVAQIVAQSMRRNVALMAQVIALVLAQIFHAFKVKLGR